MFRKLMIVLSLMTTGFIGSLTAITPCQADDARIEAELKDSRPAINPLKMALGDAAYEKALKSGEYTYTGSVKCRLCHRDFFMGRKQDLHEHSFNKSLGEKYANNAKCLGCHSTGYGFDSGFKSLKETPKLADVQCEGCHGPGSKHNALNAKGGFLAGADHPEIILKLCKACHDSRWNKSAKNIEAAYNAYKVAEAKAAGN